MAQAEQEKGLMGSTLRDSQDMLDKARTDVSAQQAKISRLLGHVSALTTLHNTNAPPQQVIRLLPAIGSYGMMYLRYVIMNF